MGASHSMLRPAVIAGLGDRKKSAHLAAPDRVPQPPHAAPGQLVRARGRGLRHRCLLLAGHERHRASGRVDKRRHPARPPRRSRDRGAACPLRPLQRRVRRPVERTRARRRRAPRRRERHELAHPSRVDLVVRHARADVPRALAPGPGLPAPGDADHRAQPPRATRPSEGSRTPSPSRIEDHGNFRGSELRRTGP